MRWWVICSVTTTRTYIHSYVALHYKTNGLESKTLTSLTKLRQCCEFIPSLRRPQLGFRLALRNSWVWLYLFFFCRCMCWIVMLCGYLFFAAKLPDEVLHAITAVLQSTLHQVYNEVSRVPLSDLPQLHNTEPPPPYTDIFITDRRLQLFYFLLRLATGFNTNNTSSKNTMVMTNNINFSV